MIKFLSEHGIGNFEFTQYYKGNSSLGSLVESLVKIVKRLLHGAIGKNILSLNEFQLFVSNVLCLTNKRPIAFKEALRDSDLSNAPDPITPELLIRGYSLPTMNIVPQNEYDYDDDPEFPISSKEVSRSLDKLQRSRKRLMEIYQSEFLTNLLSQSTDKKGRYTPKKHEMISPGSIVMLKEKHLKVYDYPMGIVKEVQMSESGEVTGATIMKGGNREVVKRHVNSLIYIMDTNADYVAVSDSVEEPQRSSRPLREAAAKCRASNKRLAETHAL